MTTNKTPIQELFKMLDEHYAFICTNQDEWLEKEEDFAYKFFEHGSDYASGSYESFSNIYSKYTKQTEK